MTDAPMTSGAAAPSGEDPDRAAHAALVADLVGRIEEAIVGQRDVVELLLDAVAARGHVLLDDVPGVAKTLLARTFAAASGLQFARIQFTPDLMPADVTGASVWNRTSNTIEFRPGPVFANVVLADEINRAPAKTQSALLEAMAEGQVTVDGTTHLLPDPFIVIATQNPIDHDGTYALPEAQLDRFAVSTSMGYPGADGEAEVVRRHLSRAGAAPVTAAVAVPGSDPVSALRAHVDGVDVHDAVIDYAVRIVEATRDDGAVRLGSSPRGSLALITLARARAARLGRGHVLPDDVKAVSSACLGHRISVSPELWIDGVGGDDVVRRLVELVSAPSPDELLGS